MELNTLRNKCSHNWLLKVPVRRGYRPRRRAAKKRDEFAAPHSITSSARPSSAGERKRELFIASAPTGSNLPTQPNTKPTHTLLQSILTRLRFSLTLAHLGRAYVLVVFPSKDDHH